MRPPIAAIKELHINPFFIPVLVLDAKDNVFVAPEGIFICQKFR